MLYEQSPSALLPGVTGHENSECMEATKKTSSELWIFYLIFEGNGVGRENNIIRNYVCFHDAHPQWDRMIAHKDL